MFGLISSSLNEMRAFTALMRVNLVENCPLKHRKVAVVGTGCYLGFCTCYPCHTTISQYYIEGGSKENEHQSTRCGNLSGPTATGLVITKLKHRDFHVRLLLGH